MSSSRIKLFFDGGCRPNPGPMEAAVVVRGVVHLFENLGHGTSGDAEWLALLCSLDLAHRAELENFELIGDSLPVIQDANDLLSRPTARHIHAAAFLAAIEKIRPSRIRWIKRTQNLAGIALAARHPR